jgi:hypothetical protein
MAEVAPAGGGGVNRTFLLIVGGLAALLVIGLLAIGALFLLPALLGPKPQVAAATMTPTRVAIATTIPTATPTPTESLATATLVIAANETTPSATATTAASTPTATSTSESSKGGLAEATATPTPSSTLPQGGLGEDLLLLAGGLGLVVVLFAARFARASA